MSYVTQRIGRGAVWAIAAIATLLLGYIAAALVLGTIPANAGWTPPLDGVPIYLEDNGIHTDVVVPVRAAGIDLTGFAPPGDIADPRYAANDWLAIGWGERGFFLGTPRWRDLRAATLLHAAIGSDDVLLHIAHVPRPRLARDVRMTMLRPIEYRRLVAALTGARRDPRPVAHGYDVDDAFYAATGHYDAVMTCNAWLGAALRGAGARIGRWTPFPVTILGWFARDDRATNQGGRRLSGQAIVSGPYTTMSMQPTAATVPSA